MQRFANPDDAFSALCTNLRCLTCVGQCGRVEAKIHSHSLGQLKRATAAISKRRWLKVACRGRTQPVADYADHMGAARLCRRRSTSEVRTISRQAPPEPSGARSCHNARQGFDRLECAGKRGARRARAPRANVARCVWASCATALFAPMVRSGFPRSPSPLPHPWCGESDGRIAPRLSHRSPCGPC
jgi:hypothetical protein